MKIYTVKTLDNGVCISSIRTEDFSALDTELMADFGEPETNIGGTFSIGAKATVTGSVDLTAGYNFATSSPSFYISYQAGDTLLITLDTNCANAAAVAAHIQAKITAAVGSDKFEVTAASGHIVISTVSAGASFYFIIGAGTPDVLTILGITPSTYTGSGEDDFTLANNLVRVKSDSPFTSKFDSRDTSLARAKAMGDMWASEIVIRIEDSMDGLRANADTFTNESMITY